MNIFTYPLYCLFLTCLVYTFSFADTNSSGDKIIFLYLKKSDNAITLEKSSIVRGSLHNRFKNTFNGIEYAVTT